MAERAFSCRVPSRSTVTGSWLATLRRVCLTKVLDGSEPFLAAYDGLLLLCAVEELAGKMLMALGGMVLRRFAVDSLRRHRVYYTNVQYFVSFSSLKGFGNGRKRICHMKAMQ